MAIKKDFSHIIMGCLFTGIHDVNRNTVLQNDDYGLIKEWADSIIALNLTGVVFHNNFSKETCRQFENKNIHFEHVNHDPAFNPNVYRYFVYQQFLAREKGNIKKIFCTDISDVTVLKSPFEQPLFLQNKYSLFCGDEPKNLGNAWMLDHAEHLRNNIKDYVAYEEKYKNEPLLNCGIIGGDITVIKQFIEELVEIHLLYNAENKTAFTGDMGAFNYLARTAYNNRLIFGEPVNTTFKAFEHNNNLCWFKHK